MNDSHLRSASRYAIVFLIAILFWVFLSEKLIRGFNIRFFNMWLHVWLFIIFVPALLFVFLYLYSRKSRLELDARRKVEDELRKSEERYQLAMAGANDGLWDWDVASGHVFYSPHYKAMLGYAGEEFEEHFDSLKKLIHPDDADRVMARIDDLLEGRTDKYEAEFRMRHKDG
ncbi:PAS domain S-box protein, partial [bacterium]|nr:PAS domain S-box protein [bacterium]